MKIQIKELVIQYNQREIAKGFEIELNSGDFCLLTGLSGSGKTSLLTYLSLDEKLKFEGNFRINDVPICELSEEKINEIKMNQIAYVSQNNLIFGELTVKENLEMFSEIGYQTINETMIEELVSKLKLKSLLNKKAKKLSGGEKQRTAIACAILKNAQLYLFDEPTSMIDIENKKAVYDVLNQLSKEGKIIVVVSHEANYFQYNKEYAFENGKIELVKSEAVEIIKQNTTQVKTHDMKKLIRNISLKMFRSVQYTNLSFILITSICIALISTIITISKADIDSQIEAAHIVNNPEIVVVNTQEYGYARSDYDIYYPITDETFEKMRAIEHVVAAEKILYFPQETWTMWWNNGEADWADFTGQPTVTLLKDGQEVLSYNYYSEQDIEIEKGSFAIYPTYDHLNINQDCSVVTTDQEGIYISKSIADRLGLTELNGERIRLCVSVPVVCASSVWWGSLEENGEIVDFERPIQPPGNIYAELEFKIKGILKTDVDYYKYNVSYAPEFFLDIDVIERIQKEYYENNQDLINAIKELDFDQQDEGTTGKYFESYISDDSLWLPRTAVIHVDEGEHINDVVNELTLIDPGLSITITSYGMVHIDEGLVRNVILNAIIYCGLIMIILLISLSIMKAYRRKRRKDDYTLLKINGFTSQNINLLEHNEILIETGFVSIIATTLTWISIHIFSTLYVFYKIRFSIYYLLLICVLTYVILLLGNYLSKFLRRR